MRGLRQGEKRMFSDEAVVEIVGELILSAIAVAVISGISYTILVPMSMTTEDINCNICATVIESDLTFAHFGGESLSNYKITRGGSEVTSGASFSFGETLTIPIASEGLYCLISGSQVVVYCYAMPTDPDPEQEVIPDPPIDEPDYWFDPDPGGGDDTDDLQDIIDIIPECSVLHLNGTVNISDTIMITKCIVIQNGSINRVGAFGSALRIETDDVLINHLKITGEGMSTNGAGVFVAFADNVTIGNCIIDGLTYTQAPPDAGRYGIRNYDSNITLINTSISNCEEGIHNDLSASGQIVRCNISNNQGIGIFEGSYKMVDSAITNNAGFEIYATDGFCPDHKIQNCTLDWNDVYLETC